VPAVLLALAAATSGAAAQIGVEVRTLSWLSAGTNSGTQALPPDTVLGNGQQVASTYSQMTCSASATSSVAFSAGAAQATATFHNQVAAGAASPSSCWGGAFAQVGRHEVLVTLTAQQPTAGRLVITATMSGLGGAAIEYDVDVGNDGTREISGSQPWSLQFVELPLTLGPGPVHVRLGASGRAAAVRGFYGGSLQQTVDFSATPGRLEPIGVPCGATLQGMLRRDGDGTRLSLAFGDDTAAPQVSVLAFGLQELLLALPPGNCLLRQTPDAVLPIIAPGALFLDLPLPYPLPPADVRIQFVTGVQEGNVVWWRTSESLRLRLP
jgi:hypothetical protein